ncbi:MAG: hypothetical protein GOVbin4691_35 [Prokaryotic dsDNA virus sp.]|nr:MAG: hypothetical protein GOVbin4691_35 [Prokaryotic dsDNA virus sp.]
MMYKLLKDENNETTGILKDEYLYIPMDEGNMDYQDYLAWLEEGNLPEENNE